MCDVRRRASPPVELTVQISPAYTKAMRFLFISGNRSSRISSIDTALYDTLSVSIRTENLHIILFMIYDLGFTDTGIDNVLLLMIQQIKFKIFIIFWFTFTSMLYLS